MARPFRSLKKRPSPWSAKVATAAINSMPSPTNRFRSSLCESASGSASRSASCSSISISLAATLLAPLRRRPHRSSVPEAVSRTVAGSLLRQRIRRSGHRRVRQLVTHSDVRARVEAPNDWLPPPSPLGPQKLDVYPNLLAGGMNLELRLVGADRGHCSCQAAEVERRLLVVWMDEDAITDCDARCAFCCRRHWCCPSLGGAAGCAWDREGPPLRRAFF
jgi:hypothetical protein